MPRFEVDWIKNSTRNNPSIFDIDPHSDPENPEKNPEEQLGILKIRCKTQGEIGRNRTSI